MSYDTLLRLLQEERGTGGTLIARYAEARWALAVWGLEQATDLVFLCQRRLEKAERVYARARPLTESEREMLARHVADGGELCCVNGAAWLEERLPRPWAIALNHWAYDQLGCGRQPEETRDGYVKLVRALKLDRFP